MHYDLKIPKNRIIGRVLREQAARSPNLPWLISGDRVVTFAEAAELVNRYAHGLASHGIKADSVVAMLMEPSIEVVLCAIAVSKLRAVFTTISTDFSGKFLDEALSVAAPDLLIADAEFAGRLASTSMSRAQRPIFINASDLGVNSPVPYAVLDKLLSTQTADIPDQEHWLDPVQVWWSSGTTGKPKGVSHSHSSLLMQTVSHDRDIRDGDTLYSCTPVYLGSSWTGTIWPSLVTGVRGAIDARFSVSRFWDRINHYEATHAFTLGAMHIHLWNAPAAPGDRENTLRRFSAIPMPFELIPLFKERFGIENMHQGYGTSETFRIFDAPEDGEKRSGAILGKPVPHLEVVLLDEDDQPVTDGDAGEICVRPRAPGLMFEGYFRDPQRTKEAWRSLWHHTGDMAYLGKDGLYRFADRKKDYIRYKGRNLSMFEVEAVVAAHPAVQDVAGFGILSTEIESESELMIAIVRKPGVDIGPEEIARFINVEAPHYFVPRYIVFVPELPRNAHGRLMKNELRDLGVTGDTWDRENSSFEILRI